MRSYLLLGVLSVLAAEPALAQFRAPYEAPRRYGYRIDSPRQILDSLTRRIESDEQFRIISPDDARRLRIEINRLMRVEWEYGHDGFSSWERRDLARQIAQLRGSVMAAEQGRFGGGGVIVPPRGTYPGLDRREYRDDRGLDRDSGRAGDDDRYGETGYEDTRETGPDLNFDRPDDQDGARYEPGGGYPEELHVGDRAPVNLGLLPPELQGRYRDGGGVYYRYWNGTIYQVDDRTGTIRWIGRPWD